MVISRFTCSLDFCFFSILGLLPSDSYVLDADMSKRAESTKLAKGTLQGPSAAQVTERRERSSFEAADLDALVPDGHVVVGPTRIPREEEVPAPRADEWVCLQSFFPRGFSLPVHPFVHGLLFAYQL